MMEEETVIEEIVKLTPFGRFRAVLKKILFFIITLKWVIEIVKTLGKFFIGLFKISIKSIHKLTSPDTWDVVLFVGFIWLLLGFATGIILGYHYGIYDQILEWLDLLENATG